MATFVLVHGGGHGGWCYKPLAQRLRAAGHDVWVPTLSGCGDRAHLVGPSIDLETHVTDVAKLLEYEDLTDVILAGHSYGGMVITGVADRAADRIRELVYLDAAHPRDGESLHVVAKDMMDMAYATVFTVDGVELVLKPAPGMAAFFGITDPELGPWVDARLTPHPWKCFSQPLVLRNGDSASRLPRTNINCTPSLNNSAPENRARQLEGDRNFEIDTGHDLMLTEPDKVAGMMLTLV